MAHPLRRVAILAPMRSELRPLVQRLSLRREGSGDDAFRRGAVAGVEIVATLTGIGMRAAARATERILAAAPVDHVLVVGIAGGIGPSLAIGDLVVPELVVDLATGAEHRPSPIGASPPRGTLVTSDGLIVDREEIVRLERRGVVAIDMETAAIGAVAARRGCPWSAFRAISDRAGDAAIDERVFGLAGPYGDPNLPALARFVLGQPRRIAQLARLALDVRRATHTAARAALAALEGL
jgi:adenosylhomocysteine nucleosidase